MKSRKAQSQLIVLNNVTSSEVGSKSNMKDSGLHLSDFYSKICSKIGIKFKTSYSIKEMISSIQSAGFDILSVRNKLMPKTASFENSETMDTEWKKRFYKNIIFDNETDKQNFDDISDHLGETYLVNELEIKASPTTIENEQIISIYGIPEVGENKSRVLIMAILAPY